MRIKFSSYILFVTVILMYIMVHSCAKISSPSGGPRDTIPPFPIYSNPANYSTEFENSEIEIEFDEFIQLQDINNALVVSPPMKEDPVVRLKGKAIDILLNDTLRDNTTYTLNFGNAIVDNNEGNPLPSFEFVFSTGTVIDSFGVSGLLLNSFDREPSEEPMYVFLYEQHHDTMPLTTIPAYLGKTNKSGYFTINNVSPGTYKIFALQDINANYLFDLPDERIAFQDSLITLQAAMFENVTMETSPDTVMLSDTAHHHAHTDTLPEPGERYIDLADSIYYHKVYGYFTQLFFFEEEVKNQYLTGHSRDDKHKLRILLNEPFKDSILLKPLIPDVDSSITIPEISENKDTLDFWLKDTTVAAIDSISMLFGYYADDTTGTSVWRRDTLNFLYRHKQQSDRRTRQKQVEAVEPTTNQLSLNYTNNNTIDLNTHLKITSYYPLEEVNSDSIHVSMLEDTLYVPVKASIEQDTADIHLIHIRHELIPDMNYRYEIFPGAVTDIYGYAHDTSIVTVKTQKTEYYGKLLLTVREAGMPLIVQLLGKDNNLIREKYTGDKDTTLLFDYLKPQAYSFKIVFDGNGNKEWDTGNYLQHLQPEKVEFIKGPITVRSNWDKEIIWSPGTEVAPDNAGDIYSPEKRQNRGIP